MAQQVRLMLIITALLITSASVFAIVAGASTSQSAEVPIDDVERPAWFDMELTDAQTGQVFSMNGYAGKVILLETMAIWCPNCVLQGNEVRKLHDALGNPEDLISITLDVDYNEDAAALKDYASTYGFDWHFAVAPLEVARALGNLYTAQYLNPPLSPMLIIDRDGNVHHLQYGLKPADALIRVLEPYLAK
jgi:cytochrome oxidase Cu insertion factor (SCO1/SenC/PrrC family)